MPECRKWHFQASRFQTFLGACTQTSLGKKGPYGPSILQLPTLTGYAAYFRTYWNPWTLSSTPDFPWWIGGLADVHGREELVNYLDSLGQTSIRSTEWVRVVQNKTEYLWNVADKESKANFMPNQTGHYWLNMTLWIAILDTACQMRSGGTNIQ